MTDLYLESDTFYLFPEPTFYRMPTNTDAVFNDYISNPYDYQDNPISKDYILQRHHDLKKDLEKVESAGMDENNAKKFYFYKGLVISFSYLLQEMDQVQSSSILQSRILELRNEIQTDLDNIKAMSMTAENGLKYNYYKGRMTAYEQTLLNSELIHI